MVNTAKLQDLGCLPHWVALASRVVCHIFTSHMRQLCSSLGLMILLIPYNKICTLFVFLIPASTDGILPCEILYVNCGVGGW